MIFSVTFFLVHHMTSFNASGGILDENPLQGRRCDP